MVPLNVSFLFLPRLQTTTHTRALCLLYLRSLLVGFLAWRVLPHRLRLGCSLLLETNRDRQPGFSPFSDILVPLQLNNPGCPGPQPLNLCPH